MTNGWERERIILGGSIKRRTGILIYPGVPHKRHLLQVREHFRGLEVLPKKFLIVFDGPLGDD